MIFASRINELVVEVEKSRQEVIEITRQYATDKLTPPHLFDSPLNAPNQILVKQSYTYKSSFLGASTPSTCKYSFLSLIVYF